MRGTIENIIFGSFIIFIIMLIVLIPILVFLYIGKWKMYKKAGESGWQAIIPVYDNYVLTQISGNNWWWFLIASAYTIFELLNIIFYLYPVWLLSIFGRFIINYNLAKKFEKDISYIILMTLFPLVMYAIIGYGSSKYNANVKVTPNGILDKDNNIAPANSGNTIKTSVEVTEKEDVPERRVFTPLQVENEEPQVTPIEIIPIEESVVEEVKEDVTQDNIEVIEKPKRKDTKRKKVEEEKKTKVKKETTKKKTIKKTEDKKPVKRSYKKKLEAEAKALEEAKKKKELKKKAGAKKKAEAKKEAKKKEVKKTNSKKRTIKEK